MAILQDPLLNKNYSGGGYSDFVDLLKGVCIIFIIITHFSWNESTRHSLLFPYWIDMAVPIFMILSGYVMAQSYKRKNIKLFSEAYSPKIIIKRVLRFVVPFVIIHILYTIMLFINGLRTGTLNDLNILKYFFFGFFNGGNGQGAYYYPLMLQFIFIFPVIYFIIKKFPKGLLICFICNIFYEILKTAYSMNEECYRLLIFRYIFAIAVGAYVAIYGINKKDLKLMIPSVLIGSAYIFLVEYTSYNPIIFTYWKGTSMLAVLFIAPIMAYMLTAFSNQAGHKLKVLCLLGKASHNIFLVQMIYYIVDSFIAPYISNVILHLAFCVVICCGIGSIFYKIEQPLTQFLTKRICKENST